MRSDLRGLCLILDQESLRMPPEHALSLVLSAGVRFVQYRNKTGSNREIYVTACRLAASMQQCGGLFILNDHPDIAAASGADGVHLGQDDLPIRCARKLLGEKAIIGISTHSREQAIEAQAAGADYIGFGPLFETATKDAGAARGTKNLCEVKNAVTIPVIAIGGITLERAGEVMQGGADGIAVISALCSAEDIAGAAAAFLREIKKDSLDSGKENR